MFINNIQYPIHILGITTPEFLEKPQKIFTILK